MRRDPRRELLGELVDDLARRQIETLSTVQRAMQALEARSIAEEQRQAQIAARLQRLEERLAPRLAPGEPPARRTGEARVRLRVEHLSKEIAGIDILSDISFEIFDNEILGLIGPNGAGKTSLMECLANLRPRSGGTFFVGDEAPPDWDPSRLMFYLPNGVMPYAELYTIEVLELFGKLFEIEPARFEQIVISDLSLGPVLRKKINALSKGNLQRVLIALALMSPQPLLALDEPFDGLDLQQTHAMMDILRGLRAQQRTLLVCIHQLNDAEKICDRLLLLSGGRVVGLGTLDELRTRAGLAAGQGSLEGVFLRLTGRRSVSQSPAGMKNS